MHRVYSRVLELSDPDAQCPDHGLLGAVIEACGFAGSGVQGLELWLVPAHH